MREWAADKGHVRLDEHLEFFIGRAKSKGYVYADWDQAFMNAIRDNWAKVGATLLAVGSTRGRSLAEDLTDRSWAER